MAIVQIDYFSDALGMDMQANVILPQNAKRRIGLDNTADETFPTLYLLHGLSDDQTAWMRRTAIERYVSPLGIAVVMPTTFRNWYSDGVYGRHFAHLTKELPTLMRSFFAGMSDKREDTYIAGISMGGFGALKAALNCPETYGAAASLSGVMDFDDPIDEEARVLFGRGWRETENDLAYQAEQLVHSGKPLPRLYQWCGTDDFLYQSNLKMRDHMENIGYPDYTYRESDGYHAWDFWDPQIKLVLEWLRQ